MWKTAAAIVVLSGTPILVPPARAWIAARWAELTGATPAASRTGEHTAAPAHFPDSERVALVFTPRGSRFTVEVAARQEAGTLRIVVRPATTARVAVRGGAGGEEFVFHSQGLRILNPESSSATYVVTLPDNLSSVIVQIAGEEAGRFDLPSARDSVVREYSLGPE